MNGTDVGEYPVGAMLTVGGMLDGRFTATYQPWIEAHVELYLIDAGTENAVHRIASLGEDRMRGAFDVTFHQVMVYDRQAYEAMLADEATAYPEGALSKLHAPFISPASITRCAATRARPAWTACHRVA